MQTFVHFFVTPARFSSFLNLFRSGQLFWPVRQAIWCRETSPHPPSSPSPSSPSSWYISPSFEPDLFGSWTVILQLLNQLPCPFSLSRFYLEITHQHVTECEMNIHENTRAHNISLSSVSEYFQILLFMWWFSKLWIDLKCCEMSFIWRFLAALKHFCIRTRCKHLNCARWSRLLKSAQTFEICGLKLNDHF